MMTVIRTVPERAHYLDHFRERLKNPIFVKDRKRSAMDTFLLSLEVVDNNPAIMFDDDALLCKGFEEKANKVIMSKPFTWINFFSMRKADIEIGSRFDNNFIGMTGFYMPPNMCKPLVEHFHNYWVPANYEGNKPTSAVDLLVRSFLKKTKQKYWIEVPNLVDHRVGKSAIDSRRSSKRVSKTFRG